MKSFYGEVHPPILDRIADAKRKRNVTKKIVVSALVLMLIAVSMVALLSGDSEGTQRALISYSPLVIATGGVGLYSSLSIGPASDQPTIVYYNSSSGDLQSATSGGSTWTYQNFSTPDDDGLYCSIAHNETLGAYGGAIGHVSFYDATNGDLMYANSIGEWYAVDTVGDVGMYSSIDVQQATGSIAIAYYDNTNHDLKLAYNKSGKTNWVIYTLDSYADVGQYSNVLFYANDDSIVVDYYNATSGNLKQAWEFYTGSNLGAWDSIDIDGSSSDVGKWNSQAGSQAGDWYGAWYDATETRLKAAWFIASNMSMDMNIVPDQQGDVGQYTSIAIDSGANMYISYYDATNGDLKIAWNESGKWYNMTVDSSGDVGQYTSIAIDTAQAIHISYYDVTNGALKYVKLLKSELMIPEFGDVIVPVIGIVAVIALFSKRRRQTED